MLDKQEYHIPSIPDPTFILSCELAQLIFNEAKLISIILQEHQYQCLEVSDSFIQPLAPLDLCQQDTCPKGCSSHS